jgi:nucleoside-diphosphate-sugar epimerase
VRALARHPEDLSLGIRRGLSLEPIPGDLSPASGSSLARAASGCRAILHVAGLVKARSFEDYREVNVGGTRALLMAARRSAPDAVFVLVSSQSAAGPARFGNPVAETDPARPVSWYGQSKLEAEELVASEWKGPWIVIRPAVVYGPADRGLLVFFAAAARGWVPVPAGRSRIQLIEASRAGAAIAAAASCKALTGRVAFLCDPEAVAIRDLAGSIARLPERAARLVPVPAALVRLAGLASTFREAITRRSLPFNADKAREILAGDWLCRPELMQRHLTLPPPSPLEYGLRNTWEWYLRERWLTL